MKKIYLKIISTGKIYAYESSVEGKSLKTKPEQAVLIETDNIVEEARVLAKLDNLAEVEVGTGKIVRLVTDDDRQTFCELKRLARQCIEEAQAKVKWHGLKMNILDADLSFDQKKLTFYFSAAGRVDFRMLVLDLAKSFDKLIRLQQVGARDEAKYFGGLGKCGRELCCSKFLNNLECLKPSQNQGLMSAGASKLTGCCGKLMCCLSFENENDKKLND